ncbi:DUF3488 domain-containing protein [Leadbettera azotonutricia]|uniref:DUF3488 domain-containing protein n=1 Tax=Leadbettera azotonutricia TaxID=150829 RepID=UPI000302D51D|nr:hypothetical protein [Leadbettera azotonutricia]
MAAKEDDGIALVLREMNVPFEERFLLQDYGGFGSSLHARLKAPGNEEGYAFVLAVPRDKPYAVETALSFAKAAVDQGSISGQADLLIAFLGDEENTLPADQGGLSHKGLRDLLSLPDMPETWILCYMDFERNPGKVLIRHGDGDYIAPLDMVRPLLRLFKSHSISAEFEIRYNELYTLGLASSHEELALAWEGEINSIYLAEGHGKGSPAEGPDPGTLAGLLLEYSESLNFPVQNPDRHYGFFSPPGSGSTVFFSETTAALSLLAMAALFIFSALIYTATYRAVFFYNMRLFFKHVWLFLIFFPLLVLILQGSDFFYSLLLRLLKRPAPPSDFPGAALTVLLAVWFLYIPSHLLDIFHIPKKQNFYGASAMMFAGIGLFIAAMLNFTYIPVFLWAFVFTFIGSCLRNPVAIFISALLIPLQAIGALYNIFESSNGALADIFLKSASPGSWGVSAQIAALSLPFMLLLKRGAVFFSKEQNKIIIPLWFRFCVFAVILGSMITHILFIPSKIPEKTRRMNENYGVVISLEETIFQESRIVEVRIRAPGDPVRFDLFLEAGNRAPLVYSAPCPFNSLNDNTIAFTLGENPPNPFTAEIVLPRELAGTFRVEAVYGQYSPTIDPDAEPGAEDYVLRFSGNAKIAK